MSTPQQLAEYAIDRSRSADAVVIVDETSGVNLRWANSSLTTNGAKVLSETFRIWLRTLYGFTVPHWHQQMGRSRGNNLRR